MRQIRCRACKSVQLVFQISERLPRTFRRDCDTCGKTTVHELLED